MKSQRHFAIMNIIAKNRIVTQEELCEALRNKGFDITQATVSRDIKEMHLLKIPDGEGYRYGLPDNSRFKGLPERMKRILKDSIANIDYSENLIVIKTLPGAAQSVASLIDSLESADILGTVAGDDTIFVAAKSKDAVSNVVMEFEHLIK